MEKQERIESLLRSRNECAKGVKMEQGDSRNECAKSVEKVSKEIV